MAKQLPQNKQYTLNFLTLMIDDYIAYSDKKLYEELLSSDYKRVARFDFPIQRKFRNIIEPLSFTPSDEEKELAAHWFHYFIKEMEMRKAELRNGNGTKRTAKELAMATTIILTWIDFITE